MRKAVIDMGTNTFNLLIADVNDRSFETIYSTKEPVLLGMGGINDNRVSTEAMSRALLALKKFAKTCDTFKIDRENIAAIGTSALRGASNSKKYVATVKRLFNIDVNIISGEDEANFIFEGVNRIYDFNEPSVIMDIGGGSTEFIYADINGVKEILSLDTGVSRIYQFLNRPEEFTSQDIQRIHDFMDRAEAGQLASFASTTMIGASGGFKTCFELLMELKYWNVNELVELNYIELKEKLETVMMSSFKERNENQWIIPIRKTMFPIVAAQILWFLNKCEITKVLISPYAMKEGAI